MRHKAPVQDEIFDLRRPVLPSDLADARRATAEIRPHFPGVRFRVTSSRDLTRRRAAAHEAGHLVVCAALGGVPMLVAVWRCPILGFNGTFAGHRITGRERAACAIAGMVADRSGRFSHGDAQIFLMGANEIATPAKDIFEEMQQRVVEILRQYGWMHNLFTELLVQFGRLDREVIALVLQMYGHGHGPELFVEPTAEEFSMTEYSRFCLDFQLQRRDALPMPEPEVGVAVPVP